MEEKEKNGGEEPKKNKPKDDDEKQEEKIEVQPFLDPWIPPTEKEEREIIEFEMELPEPKAPPAPESDDPLSPTDFVIETTPKTEKDPYLKENSIPLPKYFAELYDQFDELKRFDLKDVIYDRQT